MSWFVWLLMVSMAIAMLIPVSAGIVLLKNPRLERFLGFSRKKVAPWYIWFLVGIITSLMVAFGHSIYTEFSDLSRTIITLDVVLLVGLGYVCLCTLRLLSKPSSARTK